ncbi:hypothetical protein BKA67DRAFT_153572 [Truncatella angustata]|uniref:Uncharacterized protein n=1 Tax=Truncatella angustata TaxID=152316 RepID=A0A9P8UQU4_9PEZI|nr:uncharacterized protein BKA67DRAFT_153572 [Truncatella angustata]KAH6656355.1 hypothetical protein BKA67DRAFT_153572 [Truncatella angustata]
MPACLAHIGCHFPMALPRGTAPRDRYSGRFRRRACYVSMGRLYLRTCMHMKRLVLGCGCVSITRFGILAITKKERRMATLFGDVLSLCSRSRDWGGWGLGVVPDDSAESFSYAKSWLSMFADLSIQLLGLDRRSKRYVQSGSKVRRAKDA